MRSSSLVVSSLLLAIGAIITAPPALAADAGAEKKKVVFLAGGQSHGFGAHDHTAGCNLLAKKLKEAKPGYETVVSAGWPKDEAAFDGADAVVIYCDGGPGHMALPHIRTLGKLSKNGVGIGCIHYAVEVPADIGGEHWLNWMGGYFETHYSINPHWDARFEKLPDHPVAKAVRPFGTNDEWYYNMRFREGHGGRHRDPLGRPARRHAQGQGRPPFRQRGRARGHRQEPARARPVGQRERGRLPRLRHHRRPPPLELGPGRVAQDRAERRRVDRQGEIPPTASSRPAPPSTRCSKTTTSPCPPTSTRLPWPSGSRR
jgi:hypothetical protein